MFSHQEDAVAHTEEDTNDQILKKKMQVGDKGKRKSVKDKPKGSLKRHSQDKNSIPRAPVSEQFIFPTLVTCLSQLRSSAKGHLKIPTAKPTQHISSHGERDCSAKAFVLNCLWIFHSLCDTLVPAACQLATAFQPGDRPCPPGWRVFI